MAVQKLSSKNQIVIPKEARQAMGVKGGDELLVVVKDKNVPRLDENDSTPARQLLNVNGYVLATNH